MKETLIPMGNSAQPKIINTKAVYQYKTIIVFFIHRSKEYFVFLGMGSDRMIFIAICDVQRSITKHEV